MDEVTAELLLQQINHCLCSGLDSPEGTIGDFGFLQDTNLSISNPPVELSEASDGLLHTFFESQAKSKPNTLALEFLEDSGSVSKFTYESLNKSANQVAHLLLSHGVERDDAIPICLQKSPQYYICILGVLKAGCAFTPIDPSAPSQRKAFMLEELGAKFIITSSTYAKDLVVKDGVKLIMLHRNTLDSQPPSNPHVENLMPGHLAYRLYTSGLKACPS